MWAKALLLCNRHLKGVIGNIDVAMDTLAKCSGTGARETYEIMEYAADLIARKIRIINLRVITADMLNSLPHEKRRLLTGRYVYRANVKAFAEAEGVPVRSVYRRADGALQSCAEYLQAEGFDSEYFESRYRDERWIVSHLRKFSEKESIEYETLTPRS